MSRVDGRLKVTGKAKYAAEHDIDGTVHAVIVDSAVGRGRITGIDSRAALAQPGVLNVITHLNAPRLAYQPNPGSNNPVGGERLHVLQDDQIRFHGQPVAVVVAATLDAAFHAASLVEVSYHAERPSTDLSGDRTNEAGAYARGDADEALQAAAVQMQMTYRTSRNHHNPMEPHATIARWNGDRLTLWDKTQWVGGTQAELAAVFGIPVDSVRVISPFVGGAFGSGLRAWPHVTIAALAARVAGHPVKLVLTRKQMYFGTGFRPAYEYRVRLGCDRGGRLTAMTHDIRAETSSYENFAEGILGAGQVLYSMPNVRQAYRSVPLDVNTPIWMRGPGYATASYVIESAMDEL
ncbi:MAG TPA: molybdopterin cofactor-binding domain-containing protein, partial [Kineosporiaceae bacterium]|nr:molybdopterin cofactor-binding domain-containing protein [Kineosporiaceae bacterium]